MYYILLNYFKHLFIFFESYEYFNHKFMYGSVRVTLSDSHNFFNIMTIGDKIHSNLF